MRLEPHLYPSFSPPETAARFPGAEEEAPAFMAASQESEDSPSGPVDTVELSSNQALPETVGAERGQGRAAPPAQGAPAGRTEPGAEKAEGTGGEEEITGDSTTNPQDLTPDEEKEVDELKKRDREVRAHEQAHLAAAGSYARGVHYDYQTGPDKGRYAVGGEVNIDSSPVRDNPEATVRKSQVVKRAALAPANPSPQDRRVASQAARMESKARGEISQERAKEMRGDHEKGNPENTPGTAEAEKPLEPEGVGKISEKRAMEPPEIDISAAVPTRGKLDSNPGQQLDLLA